MDTVAIEREVERAERGSAGETGVADETERSRREQLLLRAMRWSMAHPQTGYPRFILKVSLIAYRLGLGRIDNDMTLTSVFRKS